MKPTTFLFIMVFAVVAAAGISSADTWPDPVVQKIDEITALESEKKDMLVSIDDVKVLTGEEVHKIWTSKKGVIIDTRSKTQYDTERIEGAQHLSSDDLFKDPSLADGLDKEKEYVLYCNGIKCPRSPRAAVMLKHLGFKKLYWYREGMPDWKSKGYPTE